MDKKVYCRNCKHLKHSEDDNGGNYFECSRDEILYTDPLGFHIKQNWQDPLVRNKDYNCKAYTKKWWRWGK